MQTYIEQDNLLQLAKELVVITQNQSTQPTQNQLTQPTLSLTHPFITDPEFTCLEKNVEFFEQNILSKLQTESQFKIVSETIINTDLISPIEKNRLISVLNEYSDRHNLTESKSPILIKISDKYYRAYVQSDILDISKQISIALSNKFNEILERTDINIWLKGGALLYLFKTSSDILSEKPFRFNDFDYMFDTNLNYKEKNKINTFFKTESNKKFELVGLNFELGIIKNFYDNGVDKDYHSYKYTLYTLNVIVGENKYRIDLSDYSGTPDFMFNVVSMSYTNPIPYIEFSSDQKEELCNLFLNKPVVCCLTDNIIKNLSRMSDLSFENKSHARNDIINLIIRMAKSQIKGIKVKGLSKITAENNCMICMIEPSDLDKIEEENLEEGNIDKKINENLDQVIKSDNSTQVKFDQHSEELLKSILMTLSCHHTHHICLKCLFDYSLSNMDFCCALCRGKHVVDNQIIKNTEHELKIFDDLWMQTLNIESIEKPIYKDNKVQDEHLAEYVYIAPHRTITIFDYWHSNSDFDDDISEPYNYSDYDNHHSHNYYSSDDD